MKRSEGEGLREDLARAGGASRGRGAGYPLVLRERAVAYAERCRARGEGMARVAEQLGLSRTTVAKWVRGPKQAFTAVEVVDDTSIVLVSPTGWRAEVDRETLAVLVGSR